MINKLCSYSVDENKISVPDTIRQLLVNDVQVKVIDYDYVGIAREADYASFATQLYNAFCTEHINNHLLIFLSDIMDNKPIVLRGYRKINKDMLSDTPAFFYPLEINEQQIVFLNIFKTLSFSSFCEVIKFMYSGIYDPHYLFLSSRQTLEHNFIIDLIKESLINKYNRHGDILHVRMDIQNIRNNINNIVISYPYGGTDFGSFMLFDIL